MFNILQIISANSFREIPYIAEDGEFWAPVVGYALTDTRGILPIIGWGDRGETDVLDPKTGNVFIPEQDYKTRTKGG